MLGVRVRVPGGRGRFSGGGVGLRRSGRGEPSGSGNGPKGAWHARHDTLVLALPNSIGAEQGDTLAANHLIEPGDDRRRMALRPREAQVHRLVWKG